jgi:maltooligosyltrehalose trehalohydrolase
MTSQPVTIRGFIAPGDAGLPKEEFIPIGSECRPTRTSNGVRWRVWAPHANMVDLAIINNDRTQFFAMQKNAWGYHEIELPDGSYSQRYAYRLDRGALRPDPCSVWQPSGVHNPSALYFPNEFVWSDADWRGIKQQDLVFYELHVGTFTEEGTFDAVIPRLPALKELGVTAIEIMPVAQFPGARNWGYDGAHLFAPQSTYGGPAGLQRLVDAAHRLGLAVILDVVLNHFGPEGNYIAEFGPYYSSRHSTPWGPAFNFDGYDSDPVRTFVLENTWHWIADFHLDGLRLDAVHAMFDNSPQHILSELKQCADAAAAARNSNCIIVAESLMNDVRMIHSRERGGYGLDAEWNEDFHHALFAFLTGERHGKYADYGTAEQLLHVLNDTFFLRGNYSSFRRRRWGAPVGDLPGDRFVIGTQNHDHIGNRAQGERMSHLVPPAVQRFSASLMLVAPFLPLIFMGEEYGEANPFLFFCSFEDPGLIENVRLGRARDYSLEGPIPDPQSESTYIESRLSWAWEQSEFQTGLRQLYQDLLQARRQWPAFRNYHQRAARLWPNPQHASVLELVRGGVDGTSQETITCFFNLTDQLQSLPQTGMPSNFVPIFRSEQTRYGAGGRESEDRCQLQPYECLIMGPAELAIWSTRTTRG